MASMLSTSSPRSAGPGYPDTIAGIENVRGTRFGDSIWGDSEDNVLRGGAGDDRVYGGDGDDRLFGQDGADTLSPGTGRDTVDGGAGDTDMLSYYGLPGPVTVDLTTGTAHGAGTDRIAGVENAAGTDSDDVLIGDAGDNLLNGVGGDDVLRGRDGADLLFAGPGDDHLYMGAGNDDAFLTGGNDTVRGGNGWDTVSFRQMAERDCGAAAGRCATIVADLATGVADTPFGIVTLIDIAGIQGSEFDDDLFGDERSNWFAGVGGNDIIDGRSGHDAQIYGGEGDDFIKGGPGNDYLHGGPGTDVAHGGIGADTCVQFELTTSCP